MNSGKLKIRAKLLIIFSISFIIGCIISFKIFLPGYLKEQIKEKLSISGMADVQCSNVKLKIFSIKIPELKIYAAKGSDDDFLITLHGITLKPDYISILKGKPAPSKIDITSAVANLNLSTAERYRKVENLISNYLSLLGGKSKKSEIADKHNSATATKKLPEVTISSVNFEVSLPGGMKIHSNRDTNSPPSFVVVEKNEFRISRFVFENKSVSITTQNLSFKMSTPIEKSKILLTRPYILLLLREPENLNHALAKAGSKAVDGKDKREITKHLKNTITKLIAISQYFPVSSIKIIGGNFLIGRIEENTGQFSPLISFEKIAAKVDRTNNSQKVVLSAVGQLRYLPFSVKMDITKNGFEANLDFPAVPLKILPQVVHRYDLHWNRIFDFSHARGDILGKIKMDTIGNYLSFDGKAGERGVTIKSSYISRNPVEDIYLTIEGNLKMTFNPFSISGEEVEMSISGIPVTLTTLEFTGEKDGNVLKLQATLPPTKCQTLFTSLPFELRSNLSGFQFGGILGANFQAEVNFTHPDNSSIDFSVNNQCEVISQGKIDISKLQKKFKYEVVDSLGQHSFTAGPETKNWTPIDEISPYMIYAVITSEDGAFFLHKGVSAYAIKRAVIKDLKAKGFYFGASTITMQLIKNLFLSREKTISRKLQEMILSWWLEQCMNKRQILELYLNVIEYGPKIYGIKNAAQYYFNKTPAELSLLESIFLAKMLPNPVTRHDKYFLPSLESGILIPKWKRVIERVATKMHERGYITDDDLNFALNNELHFQRDTHHSQPSDEEHSDERL